YAAWLVRQVPIYLCIARMGRHTLHVFLRTSEGHVIDPSVIHGMRPPRPYKYQRKEVRMLLTPDMFSETTKGDETVEDTGNVWNDIAGVFTNVVQTPIFRPVPAGVSAVATAVFPPAGLAIGAASAGLQIAAGVVNAARAPSGQPPKTAKGRAQ